VLHSVLSTHRTGAVDVLQRRTAKQQPRVFADELVLHEYRCTCSSLGGVVDFNCETSIIVVLAGSDYPKLQVLLQMLATVPNANTRVSFTMFAFFNSERTARVHVVLTWTRVGDGL